MVEYREWSNPSLQSSVKERSSDRCSSPYRLHIAAVESANYNVTSHEFPHFMFAPFMIEQSDYLEMISGLTFADNMRARVFSRLKLDVLRPSSSFFAMS